MLSLRVVFNKTPDILFSQMRANWASPTAGKDRKLRAKNHEVRAKDRELRANNWASPSRTHFNVLIKYV